MRSTLNSRLSPTYTNRRYFEFAREPYACFHSTRIAAKGAIFIYLECFQHSGNSSVVASYLSGRQQQKVFDSGGALTVVVFYRLPLHAASLSQIPLQTCKSGPSRERCPRALPPTAMADDLAAVGSAGIALDSDAATRASLWIGCALASWSHSLRGHRAGATGSGADERSQEHRPPLSQPLSAFVSSSVLCASFSVRLSQSQPTVRRILAA